MTGISAAGAGAGLPAAAAAAEAAEAAGAGPSLLQWAALHGWAAAEAARVLTRLTAMTMAMPMPDVCMPQMPAPAPAPAAAAAHTAAPLPAKAAALPAKAGSDNPFLSALTQAAPYKGEPAHGVLLACHERYAACLAAASASSGWGCRDTCPGQSTFPGR
jgi:hypothetical protein